jgi:hypothetical protein
MAPEYMALSKAPKHFLWLKTALNDLRFPQIPMVLVCDNRSDLAYNYQIVELSKHINIHHHPVQEFVSNTTLLLIYIPTTNNLVDMFTKGLPEVQLFKLRSIALQYNEGGY